MHLKKGFEVYEVMKNDDGSHFTDPDGACFLKPHSVLFGKDFANPNQVVEYVKDAESRASAALSLKEIPDEKDLALVRAMKGSEFVILEILKFY